MQVHGVLFWLVIIQAANSLTVPEQRDGTTPEPFKLEGMEKPESQAAENVDHQVLRGIGETATGEVDLPAEGLEEGQQYTLNGNTFVKSYDSIWGAIEALMNTSDPDLHEGDMKVYPGDSNRMAYTHRVQWPQGIIPYMFDPDNFDPQFKPLVEASMQELMDETSVIFVDITNDTDAQNRTHLFITSAYYGCWSYVGMVPPFTRQPLNLFHSDFGTCMWLAIVIHELIHALGCLHTQNRDDRDPFLRVIEENIFPPYISQFEKYPSDNFGLRYDYGSVMQYSKDAFGWKTPSATMFAYGYPDDTKTNIASLQYLLGRASTASFEDFKTISRMYNDSCHCPTIRCHPIGGRITKDCVCKCRHNWEGGDCSTEIGPPFEPVFWDICGPSLVTEPGHIQTLNYPYPHCADTSCLWHIVPPPGYRSVITFSEFDFFPNPGIDFLDVYAENLWTGKRYTGCELRGETITSDNQNGTMLRWRTGYICGTTGFQAQVTFERILPPCVLKEKDSVLGCKRCQWGKMKYKGRCRRFQDCECVRCPEEAHAPWVLPLTKAELAALSSSG